MKPSDSVFRRGLSNPPSDIRLFLLYGADEAESHTQADQLIRTLGPDANRILISGEQLREDAGLLDGAARSQSLFGGKSGVILNIDNIDPCMKAIERLVEADDSINLVIAIAGGLPGTNKLIKYASAHPAIWLHPNYPLDQKSGTQAADLMCRSHGLRATPGVAQRLFEASNGDRALLASEVAKLSLFLNSAPEHPRDLSHDHLDEILAGLSAEETGGLVDAILGGKPGTAMDRINELESAGVDSVAWIRALTRRTQLLFQLREDVDGGRPADIAMKSARVFFKDIPAVERQLRLWPRSRLERLATRLMEAERLSKSGRPNAPLEIKTLLLHTSRSAERAAA